MQKNDLSIIKKKTQNMEAMVTGYTIKTDEELVAVSDKTKQIRDLQKFIEQEKDKFAAPAKQIIKEANTKYNPYIEKCKNAVSILKGIAEKFMFAKIEKRREQEEKIAAKVEAGSMKTDTAIKKLETLSEAPKTISTDSGSGLRMSTRRVAKVVNPDLIPKEFWVIDEVKVRREALERDKKGLPQIPGVAIQEESYMSSI